MQRCPFPVLLASIILVLLTPIYPFRIFPTSHHVKPTISSVSDIPDFLSHRPPSFAYETDWYRRVVPFATLNTEKCRLCRYPSRTSGSDSSDNDAIITFTTGRLSGLIPFCRSVRTVGCNAQVVILSNPATFAKLTKSEENIISNCGVTLVSYGQVASLRWETEVIFRFSVIYDYLYHHKHLFGRVFIVRLSDVMFQSDPFTPDISSDSVYFVQQETTLNDMRTEKYEFRNLPVNFEEFQDRKIISNCVLAGGPDPLLIFLDIYLYLYSMIVMDIEQTSETAFFMYCVWQFAGRSKRLSYRMLTNSSGIVSMATFIYPTIDQRVGNVIIPKTGKHASVIMNYYSINRFVHSYYDACPREKMKANDYMPAISEGYINGTLDRFGKPVVIKPPVEEEEE
jgi:hypothetical protein